VGVSRREFLASLAAVEFRPTVVAIGVKSGRVLYSSGGERAVRIHPGSTAKPFTAIALIDAGETSKLNCSGDLQIGVRRLPCTHPIVDGPVVLPVALAYSCNQFFSRHAEKLEPVQLSAIMQRFGFAAQTPESLEQRALMAIGEWGIFATVGSIAQAYRRLALLSISSPDKYRALWEGMYAATEYGTARLARPDGVVVAGKTGTSPARNRSGTHALFGGWAPAGAPQVIVTVVVPGGRGATDAAPVARALFEKLL
jgi:cell division protein FtsI/penicillin-binding protein 2